MNNDFLHLVYLQACKQFSFLEKDMFLFDPPKYRKYLKGEDICISCD